MLVSGVCFRGLGQARLCSSFKCHAQKEVILILLLKSIWYQHKYYSRALGSQPVLFSLHNLCMPIT